MYVFVVVVVRICVNDKKISANEINSYSHVLLAQLLHMVLSLKIIPKSDVFRCAIQHFKWKIPKHSSTNGVQLCVQLKAKDIDPHFFSSTFDFSYSGIAHNEPKKIERDLRRFLFHHTYTHTYTHAQ